MKKFKNLYGAYVEVPEREVKTRKYEFVFMIAKNLIANGTTMKGSILKDILNNIGFTTENGQPYTESTRNRGVFRMLSAAYDFFTEMGYHDKACIISHAFVTEKEELPQEIYKKETD